MAHDNVLNVTCKCGLIWKIPLGEGRGLCVYSFQCDGDKGCRRHISIHMEGNSVKDKGAYSF